MKAIRDCLSVAALALSAVLVSAGNAWAAESAEDHYDKGLALMEQDVDPMSTLIEFLSAYKLDPKPGNGRLIGTHYVGYDPEFQIARIYVRLGRIREAKRYLDLCEQYGYTPKSVNRAEYAELRNRISTEIEALQPQGTPPEVEKKAAAMPPPASERPPLPAVQASPVPPPPETPLTSKPLTLSEVPARSQEVKNPTMKNPPSWESPLRSALQLYLAGAPRNDISRQLERARTSGALEELDRPGALYVVACFYAEEYVRSAKGSNLQLAKRAYRRLFQVAPDYAAPASLRQEKVEELLKRWAGPFTSRR